MSTTESPTPPPRRRTSIASVRRDLRWVIEELKAGRLDPRRANALVYACSTLAAVIERADFERRIARLEAAAETRAGGVQ
jgi:hypothetical protein